MLHIKLTESKRKEFLKSFSELEMQKELKILFEKMYKTSVYILQGQNEFGKDLIIKIEDPMNTRYISVVVKMGDISGKALDSKIATIRNQIEQSFEKSFRLPDDTGDKIVNEVYVVLFGDFSNNAQENIDIFINKRYPRQVTLFDITKMDKFFFKHYPEIFCGASGFEALIKKDEELDELLLQKDKFLSISFISPNIKKFSKSNELSISHLSESRLLKKTIDEKLFGVQESIEEVANNILNKKEFILIEGEAGSGKSIFSIKLAQELIKIAINELPANKQRINVLIKVPILINSTKLIQNSMKTLVQTYYQDSTYNFIPIVIIIDGLDEIEKQDRLDVIERSINYANKENISLIFTCRKNFNLKEYLHNFTHYEIEPFELSQAINYVRKIITNNEFLLESLLKGLKQIEHQIPFYPMALSLLVELVKEHSEVPASISELYSRYINLALGEKDLSKGIAVLFDYKIKRNFLSELSYFLFFLQNNLVIEYNYFYEFTENYVQSHRHINDLNIFIDEIKRSSLLKFDDNIKVEFLHKSFLDYFVADYFFSNRNELEDKGNFEQIYELYYIDFWNEVALFYFGIQTKITPKILDKIIKLGNKNTEKLSSNTIELFMLGRLMQYAWYSTSDAKELVIKNASNIVLDVKHEILELLEEKAGIKNLPTISSDIATLHLFDLSYSSLFLINEIKIFISQNFNLLKEKLEISDDNDKSLLYFSSIFILTNHKLIRVVLTSLISHNIPKLIYL